MLEPFNREKGLRRASADQEQSTSNVRGEGMEPSIESRKPPRLHELIIATLRSAMDGFWVVDAEGRFLEVNDTYCDLLGYSRDELLTMSIHDVEAAESAEEVSHHIAKVRAQGRDRFRSLHRRRDGAILDMEVSSHYLADEGGIFIVFVRDVSDSVREERALRSSREVLEREVTEREAEAALLRTAIEYLPVSVMVTDREGRIQYVNSAFTRITGYQPDDVLGNTPRVLKSGAQDEAVYRSLWSTILSGQEWRGEVLNRKKDGTHYIQELVIAPVKDGEGNFLHFVGIGHDVTERRRGEDALREGARLLAESQRVARLGSYRLDCASGAWTGSDVLDEVFGIRNVAFPRDVTGWLSIVHEEDREEMAAYFTREVLGKGKSFDREYRIVRPTDGEQRWMHGRGEVITDDHGRPVEMLGTVQDITERKRVEADLLAQETLFRSLIENSADLIGLVAADGRGLYLCPAFERLVGFPVEEWLGKSLLDLVHRDDRKSAEATLARCLESPGEAVRWQLRVRNAKGALRSWSGSATNFLRHPAVKGIVVNWRDVTEEQRILEALRASEAQLHQAQKLEAVGQLAGGVAHDFNNILTVISGHAELSLGELPSGDATAGAMREILEASRRAASLTRQLLAFSRKQILQPRVLDINELVSVTEKMLRRLIGEHIRLVSRLQPDLGSVMADPGQMEQVLMNLAVNSRDAMPEGGELVFATENTEVQENETGPVASMGPGAYVKLTVTDSGHGMDEETRSRVFEPFFTTKTKGRGTGLGLSTVYGIVNQSGGHIDLHSEIGKGTSFRIYFPRVDGPPERAPEDTAIVTAGGGETLLLVEDEKPVLKFARAVLERAGYRVLTASNGVEALRLVEEYSGPIDLLVTDVVMPGMGGHALSESIQPLRQGLPVLYTSGYTDDAIVHHGVLDSGTDFLEKPYSQAALLRAVRKVLTLAQDKASPARGEGAR